MRELDSDQVLFIAAVLVIFAFVVAYASVALLSQLRPYRRLSPAPMQMAASSFDAQSSGSSISQMSSSSDAGRDVAAAVGTEIGFGANAPTDQDDQMR